MSGTAAAIRAAECSAYPLAVIVSQGEQIAYAFMSNSFKNLDKLSFLRKGMPLPDSETLRFNKSPANILHARRANAETTLNEWFDCPRRLTLDEEVIGLGKYGYTLTVLSSELLPDDPAEEEDEDAALEESWTLGSLISDDRTSYRLARVAQVQRFVCVMTTSSI